MRGDDGDVRGHAGLQFLVGVADGDDGVVGDDVLHGDGGVPHLHDFAAEGAGREGVDGELHLLVDFDAANVGLGDAGVDLGDDASGE